MWNQVFFIREIPAAFHNKVNELIARGIRRNNIRGVDYHRRACVSAWAEIDGAVFDVRNDRGDVSKVTTIFRVAGLVEFRYGRGAGAGAGVLCVVSSLRRGRVHPRSDLRDLAQRTPNWPWPRTRRARSRTSIHVAGRRRPGAARRMINGRHVSIAEVSGCPWQHDGSGSGSGPKTILSRRNEVPISPRTFHRTANYSQMHRSTLRFTSISVKSGRFRSRLIGQKCGRKISDATPCEIRHRNVPAPALAPAVRSFWSNRPKFETTTS